jgi:hypothetical protein
MPSPFDEKTRGRPWVLGVHGRCCVASRSGPACRRISCLGRFLSAGTTGFGHALRLHTIRGGTGEPASACAPRPERTRVVPLLASTTNKEEKPATTPADQLDPLPSARGSTIHAVCWARRPAVCQSRAPGQARQGHGHGHEALVLCCLSTPHTWLVYAKQNNMSCVSVHARAWGAGEWGDGCAGLRTHIYPPHGSRPSKAAPSDCTSPKGSLLAVPGPPQAAVSVAVDG